MTFWGPSFDDLQSTDPEIAGLATGEVEVLRAGALRSRRAPELPAVAHSHQLLLAGVAQAEHRVVP